MAATVLTGTGSLSYTNSTGGNVRVIVMSCRTTGITSATGTVTCGTATYPVYPDTIWGKGVSNSTALTPVEYMVANGDVFKIESTPTGPTGQEVITNTTSSNLTGNWTVPANVTNVSVVCVGSGSYQGSGGALAWKATISVTPGQQIPYQVGRKTNDSGGTQLGGDTWFFSSATCYAPGGVDFQNGQGQVSLIGDGGGQAGHGAGGYLGKGGDTPSISGQGGTAGEGGGGGGAGFDSQYGSGWGGGVGLKGIGPSGAGGSNSGGGSVAGTHGQPGSGGSGVTYGGGGAAYGTGNQKQAGQGAIRIIWGDGRTYPGINTGDDESSTGDDTEIVSYNVVVIPEGN